MNMESMKAALDEAQLIMYQPEQVPTRTSLQLTPIAAVPCTVFIINSGRSEHCIQGLHRDCLALGVGFVIEGWATNDQTIFMIEIVMILLYQTDIDSHSMSADVIDLLTLSRGRALLGSIEYVHDNKPQTKTL